MQNPLNPTKELTEAQAARVEELRTVRRNAKKAARSGHPGRRAEAERALAQVNPLIERIYRAAVSA